MKFDMTISFQFARVRVTGGKKIEIVQTDESVGSALSRELEAPFALIFNLQTAAGRSQSDPVYCQLFWDLKVEIPGSTKRSMHLSNR
jgi:hypothetical protein